jgi:hypothetical protein
MCKLQPTGQQLLKCERRVRERDAPTSMLPKHLRGLFCADIAPGRCNYFNFLSSRRQFCWRRFLLPSDSTAMRALARWVITVMCRKFNERIRKCSNGRLRSPREEFHRSACESSKIKLHLAGGSNEENWLRKAINYLIIMRRRSIITDKKWTGPLFAIINRAAFVLARRIPAQPRDN